MSSSRRVAGLPAGRRSKWVVLVFWLIVLGALGPLSGKLSEVQQNDASSWLPGSAESTKALQASTAFQAESVQMGVVIYERESGITPADTRKANGDLADYAKIEGAGKPLGPFPAKDGKAIEVLVPVDLGSGGWDKAGPAVDRIRGIASDGADGANIAITGQLGFAADSAKAFEGIDGVLLFGALIVVVVLLLITYRSPILWLVPVISVVAALGAAQGLVYLLAKHAGLTVDGQSAAILTVLVFGAGTDYALLLMARYREELRRHADRHEAMTEALHRAGPAIIASAATVAVGMLTLSVAQVNSTAGLGPVLAIGVAVGLLAMTTLLPAIMVLCGRWVFWPLKPKMGSAEPTTTGMWSRVGGGIARRPRVVWVVTALVLGALALGMTSLKADGLANAQSFTKEVDSVAGEAVLTKHFPAGSGAPIQVVGNAASGAAMKAALNTVDGVTDVTDPVVKGNVAYLEGTLTDAADSDAAYATVDRARDTLHAVAGADAKVGGPSAIVLDLHRANNHDRNVIIPIVLAVVLVILGLLLRSIVAPVLLVATVVLSFVAALGLSSLVFTHLFHWQGEDVSFPLFVFVFLVALGIDYNIFLMTRVREEAVKRGARRGALVGLAATGAVITSAGAVLAGTFAVLATLPLVAFAEIGFAVAVGVLMDTIIVRSVLVTALGLDLGRWMWWPSKLFHQRDPERADPTAAQGEEPALVD